MIDIIGSTNEQSERFGGMASHRMVTRMDNSNKNSPAIKIMKKMTAKDKEQKFKVGHHQRETCNSLEVDKGGMGGIVVYRGKSDRHHKVN